MEAYGKIPEEKLAETQQQHNGLVKGLKSGKRSNIGQSYTLVTMADKGHKEIKYTPDVAQKQEEQPNENSNSQMNS